MLLPFQEIAQEKANAAVALQLESSTSAIDSTDQVSYDLEIFFRKLFKCQFQKSKMSSVVEFG